MASTTTEIDADGTWDVTTFDAGVKARQLRIPAAAWRTARAAESTVAPHPSIESRLAALEAKAGIVTVL